MPNAYYKYLMPTFNEKPPATLLQGHGHFFSSLFYFVFYFLDAVSQFSGDFLFYWVPRWIQAMKLFLPQCYHPKIKNAVYECLSIKIIMNSNVFS